MANFLESFNKGLKAADTARANKEEINSVIEQLSDQLSGAVDGKLKIEIIQKSEPIDTFNLSPKDFLTAVHILQLLHLIRLQRNTKQKSLPAGRSKKVVTHVR